MEDKENIENSVMPYLSGSACIVGGTAAYVLLMSAEVVPTALDLAGNLGMSVSARAAWWGNTAIAIAVALGLDKWLSRRL